MSGKYYLKNKMCFRWLTSEYRQNYLRRIFISLACILLVVQLVPVTARNHRGQPKSDSDEEFGGTDLPKKTRHHKEKLPTRRTQRQDGFGESNRQTTLQTKHRSRANNDTENDSEMTKSSRHHIVITTQQGKVRGKIIEPLPDSKVACFLGIQYAEPPVGTLRFKKSTPAKEWSGVRDALQYSNTCYQWRDNTFGKGYPGTEMWNANTPLSEDCLYLNVWTPMNKQNELLPVMVWIYGGGFYSGTSSLDVYDGQWLASSEKVVVVSMNYRVAALGFLTLGNTEIPGNAGLWDQNLALKWVRNNIRHFGGDPFRVTLFGESAGAASIALHIVSEQSKGLFQNVILQSASALSPWAILPTWIMEKRAVHLAEILGCFDPIETPVNRILNESVMKTATSCLYSMDPQTLVDTEMAAENLGTARFANAAVADGVFLTEDSVKRLQKGLMSTEINILAGFNANEGNYFLVYTSPGFNITVDEPIDWAQYRVGLNKGLCTDAERTKREVSKLDDIANVLADAIDFEYTDFESTLNDKKFCSKTNNEYICVKPTSSGKVDGGGSQQFSKNNYKDILDHIIGDTNFICPTINFMRNIILNYKKSRDVMVDGGEEEESPVGNSMKRGRKYLYQVLHRSSKTPWPEWMGVLHGYEIELVFGMPLDKSLDYTEEEVELSLRLMKYWANFARSSDPNVPEAEAANNMAAIRWPEYELEKEASFIFNVEPVSPPDNGLQVVNYVKEQTKSRHCTFWRSYYPILKDEIDTLSDRDYKCKLQETGRNAAVTLGRPSISIPSLTLFTIFIRNLPVFF